MAWSCGDALDRVGTAQHMSPERKLPRFQQRAVVIARVWATVMEGGSVRDKDVLGTKSGRGDLFEFPVAESQGSYL